MTEAESNRRTFLNRMGLFGVLAGAAVALPVSAYAGPSGTTTLPSLVLDLLRPALNTVSRQTYNALTVFAVPGPDEYSKRQGTPRSEPGAIEARATDFMLHALDNFVPFPDELARPIAGTLAAGLGGVPITLSGGLLGLDLSAVDSLGGAVDALLDNDEVLPLSMVIALLLNSLALRVNPLSATGVLQSPFARLSYAEKAKAFSLLEGGDSGLVGAADGDVPEPLRDSVSGLGRFLGGSLITFSTFSTYSEWAVFSPSTRSLTGVPVGWKISDYDAGVLDGWDDLRGYYQNRKAVSA
ncbi:hypothetical protein SAMN05192558_101599 [Actinokineospora alba]|uniref:Uncharacterized protein n=1 Tax=Actinokineospora alba TaxID=504798 RepID=A0A1H0FZZ4_9PSEU|nr:hypothetical protein [Actinokineospora alba]TDP69700.1 hypothetical protein C8E96_5294 [Actinokineospora alba]SDI10743.1 hypothetical protein SAMN05421871_103272 [Actinokineospora alba]SDO00203.1 hypothetical protein SAMN05192558_101599 [Actinokineospora alba]